VAEERHRKMISNRESKSYVALYDDIPHTGRNFPPRWTQWFKPHSTLHEYLHYHSDGIIHITRTEYETDLIAVVFRNIINEQKMFDSTNPAIVICTEELESAIDRSVFHVDDLLYIVEEHTTYNRATDPYPHENAERLIRMMKRTSLPYSHHHPFTEAIPVNLHGKYAVTQGFLEVLQTLPELPDDTMYFDYGDITHFLSIYMVRNQARLFDARSPKIAKVKNDPLG